MDIFLHSSATLNIANALANLGHEVNLISVRSKHTPSIKNERVHMFFVPLRYVPMVSSLMFAVVLFFFLPVFIITSKPDYVILGPSVSITGFLSGRLVSKFKKVKFIMDIRSFPVETVGLGGFATEFLYSLCVLTAKKWFDGLTTLTHLMKTEICQSFNIDPSIVGVWTSGVSDSLFSPENLSLEGSKLKSILGLSKKFIVFYHGIFTANRGLMETMESMKIILRKYPNIVLFLLGTGPLINTQKAFVQKENLQENVILHSPVSHEEVPKFIAMCDVGIIPLPNHPYWNSQNPIKLLEYLAMQKVVILTKIPAHQAVIGKAENALYISSTKPIEIADAIEYAYINRAKLESWGRIGREIIREKYTWQKVALDLENYLSFTNNK
jgi:glycosyltransferase involved in cell wall biosynthesis